MITQQGASNMSPKDVQAQQKDFRDQNLALIQLLSRLESSNLQQHRETRAMILGRNANTIVGQNNEGISANPEPLEVTRDEEEKIRLEIKFRILESLSFSTMTSRFDEVSEAYDNTFNWIFYDSTTQQRPWSSFRDWLIYGTGVYWVNGKAGSGKSTLMRHIVDDPRIQQYLLQWAQERPLSKARFFFWNSGSQEQNPKQDYFALSCTKYLTNIPSLSQWCFQEPGLDYTLIVSVLCLP
jgi:hypothetical protein